jgi:hypothetical protein
LRAGPVRVTVSRLEGPVSGPHGGDLVAVELGEVTHPQARRAFMSDQLLDKRSDSTRSAIYSNLWTRPADRPRRSLIARSGSRNRSLPRRSGAHQRRAHSPVLPENGRRPSRELIPRVRITRPPWQAHTGRRARARDARGLWTSSAGAGRRRVRVRAWRAAATDPTAWRSCGRSWPRQGPRSGPAWPYPRRGFSVEAVQTPARVNVTCVTPLGEEVASTS